MLNITRFKSYAYRGRIVTALLVAVSGIITGLPAIAADQDWATKYAKTGKGLLTNDQEMTLGMHVNMSGYFLHHKNDHDLCLAKDTTTDYSWCMSKELPTYKNVRKILFTLGMLQALDGAGKVIWHTTPKKDPYAKIMISPEGTLMITNSVGAIYWSKP